MNSRKVLIVVLLCLMTFATTMTTKSAESRSYPLDIYFLLDTAEKFTDTFMHQLQFLKDCANQFLIGPKNVKMGVATFSTFVHEQIRLGMYEYIGHFVAAVRFIPMDNGTRRRTDLALDYARKDAFDNGGRFPARRVVVLFTTKSSAMPFETCSFANLLKEHNFVKVISVGFYAEPRSGTLKDELLTIASDSAHCFTVTGGYNTDPIVSKVTSAIKSWQKQWLSYSTNYNHLYDCSLRASLIHPTT